MGTGPIDPMANFQIPPHSPTIYFPSRTVRVSKLEKNHRQHVPPCHPANGCVMCEATPYTLPANTPYIGTFPHTRDATPPHPLPRSPSPPPAPVMQETLAESSDEAAPTSSPPSVSDWIMCLLLNVVSYVFFLDRILHNTTTETV